MIVYRIENKFLDPMLTVLKFLTAYRTKVVSYTEITFSVIYEVIKEELLGILLSFVVSKLFRHKK